MDIPLIVYRNVFPLTMHKATLNICVQGSFLTYAFISLGKIPKSWVVGADGRPMFKF